MDGPSISEPCSEALAAWNLPETLLDGVDPDARPLLWRALCGVLEKSAQEPDPPPGAARDGGATGGRRPASGATSTAPDDATGGAAPAPTLREPLPFAYQHYARPRFQQCHLRDLDLAGWHKKLRLALWMAAEALETLQRRPSAAEYLTLLAEQCAWMGQLYADLKRRAGSCFAPVIFQGELRLLQYRASAAVTDLLFAA